MKTFLVFNAILLGALASAAKANDLMVDGSFEGQAQAVGTWGVYAAIPGWVSDTGDGIELRNALAGTAFDGSNFAELDSHGNSTISQVISTLANVRYDLSFAYSPRAGVAADSNPIEVLWDGRLLASVTANGIGLNGLDWQVHHFDVTGSGHDTLSFRAAGISDSLGGSLDAVSLTSPVPEPASRPLLVMGLALSGIAWRGLGRDRKGRSPR